MNEIEMKVLEDKLTYKGEVILTYKIKFPQLRSARHVYAMQVFNSYNRKIAYDLKKYAEGELFEQAKETYEYNKKNGYPTMVYEVLLEYMITFNQKDILSLYMDQYTFTGGAHGNTIRTSQNWNLVLAKQIPLQNIEKDNPYFIVDILKEINKQIKAQIETNPSQYFDNYCQLVLDTFRLENYYITPKGIVIYFQQYDIAPYSSGIPIFLIER